MKPNLFIIGAQKAASTFVQSILSRHPQIYLKPNEEPFFEDPDYNIEKIDEFEKNLLKNSTKEDLKYLGIKRPNYLGKKEVASRIFNYYPNARLIIVLRNPIERAVSAYFHYIRGGFIPIEDVESGMRKIISGDYKKDYSRSSEIIDFGFYYKHLNNYLKYFKKEQIHIILFDDIKKDSGLVALKIFNFLDLDFQNNLVSIENKKKRKPQEVVYSLGRLKLLSLKNYFVKYNEEKTRVFLRYQTFFEKIIYNIILGIDRYILRYFFDNKKPALSLELRSQLLDIYREDINKLSVLINRDLSDWNKK